MSQQFMQLLGNYVINCFNLFHLFFTTYRGVYNFVGPPTPHPQPRTHRAAAYRALAHEPQPREPMPIGLQPREL